MKTKGLNSRQQTMPADRFCLPGSQNEPQEGRLRSSRGIQLARRSFMQRLTFGGASLLPVSAAFANDNERGRAASISDGDAAILRFLAAAEIIETDLWQQYTEFANLDGPYQD